MDRVNIGIVSDRQKRITDKLLHTISIRWPKNLSPCNI